MSSQPADLSLSGDFDAQNIEARSTLRAPSLIVPTITATTVNADTVNAVVANIGTVNAGTVNASADVTGNNVIATGRVEAPELRAGTAPDQAGIKAGVGNPDPGVSGLTGSLFLRTDTGQVYVNISPGGTGTSWTVVGSGLVEVGRTTLAVAANTITVSGLDGDADIQYEVEFNFTASGLSAHDISIRPNGDTNAGNRGTQAVFGNTVNNNTAGVIAANGGVATAVIGNMTMLVFASRAAPPGGGTTLRQFIVTNYQYAGNSPGVWRSQVVYNSNVDNLTSIVVAVTNINFTVGTELIVRKRA